MKKVLILISLLLFSVQAEDFSKRLTLLCESYGKNHVAIRNEAGEILWKQKVRTGQHDVHMLANGNILLQDDWRRIVEITLDKKVVWSYDAGNMNGNKGKGVEVHAFVRLDDGITMIAESGPKRLVFVDKENKQIKKIDLKVDKPDVHRDTRLVRQLANGNWLACHENDHFVREYNAKSEVVWEYDTGNKVYGAIGLKNGNYLIATGGGNSVIEVNKGKEIVWEISKKIPGTDKNMKWMTTLVERDNGNLIIGNCHAGQGSPQMFEITRDKKLVWEMEDFKNFGNGLAAGLVLDGAQAQQTLNKLKSIPAETRVNDKLLEFK
ncbi:hypothetical protein LNTAR_02182 [Lentisphaera araneosa HTCC2155]|uniref:Arylsulfotransferase (ASST) n=1 Tax=Lentisphaera araneosa HTCC2155 TaxID=313628 RepID=A6DP46_9BACT|nr:PQQ-binding-like beta-propeller repeat protein [Lentisphaera araneosa]EDM26578.1 hypothetical protein LNTAR_02182 [Lentisphaera araneosa HTCC2155]